jgi:pilus assembly protein CpaC
LSGTKLEAVRQQLARDFPSDDINVTFENDTVFLRGTVKDVTAGERAVSIASTLGKTVNLLRVEVPPVAAQVLLKVRFASVDRSNSLDVGLNLFNGSFNQQTSLGTGPAVFPNEANRFPVPQSVNLLFIRPDINLVAELQALQAKRILEMLAEPNVLAISGEQASLLAGGEFPFPVVQPSSSGTAAISIMWREYGVRLNFLPNVTARGSIRLKVAPEVSSLDYTNAVTVQGFTIPGLSSRRVQTDVELESGQSFIIAGLLDNQARDSLSKVPGIGNIPLIGKLFQSKSIARSNSELLVIITPELVRPIPADQPIPELKYPTTFLPTNTAGPLRHPGMDKTGPVPMKPAVTSLPFEELVPKKDAQPVVFQPTPGTQMNPGSNLGPPQQPPPPPAGAIK